MRIAICDDIKGDVVHLHELLKEYLYTNSLDADIDTFESGEALLSAFEPGKYQIIFQDIYMNGMTGMEVAEQIRETDKDVAIILTTASLEHGIASYKVNAAYYIVKPVEQTNLTQGMARCHEHVNQYAKVIEIMENRQSVRLRLRDIFYVESQKRACVFQTATEEIKTNSSIDKIAGQLNGFPFVRCHRSFIVNLLHVADMLNQDFVMESGAKVPISKSCHAAAKKAFKEFFRAKMKG
ncbi:LytTR family DNA-binding domain-containing protein [Sedimentibacter sp.]|uniref:LytR/AlgR family response regulator transcription factor n=1 Tax=Sedimentibacter sp. TaxID=1960295 RepID=UPI0028AB9C20|nr:LytTR family DNA-binding domain-containing protein [Sedimentibacter sp.]